jgi:hypothetical protein
MKTRIKNILLVPAALGFGMALGLVVILSWFIVPLIIMLVWNAVFPSYAISIWAVFFISFQWGIAGEAIRERRKKKMSSPTTPDVEN